MNTDDIPPDIDFSNAERGKYAERAKRPEGWHRYVISEILKSDDREYQNRTWAVDAPNRTEAVKEIRRAHPTVGTLRIVDSTEGK